MNTHLPSGVRQHRLSPNVRASRSGVSLILVMFSLSMSLVLTYSFIQTQSITTQISENGSHREQAMNAARAGITDALNRMNSLDWSGVGDHYQRTFQSDADGNSTYSISFNAPATSLSSLLELEVTSLGAWVSAQNSNMRSEYQISVKVRLVPRLNGRTILPGDSADAIDLVTNPGDYDLIRKYALFAEEGTRSLTLDPCDRVDGTLWLYDDLNLFNDPAWNSSTRSAFVQDLGNRFVTFPSGSSNLSEASIHYPHPMAGNITFYNTPNSVVQQDLADLKVNWSVTPERLTIPSRDDSLFSTYQIYTGGPTYHAVSLNSSLSDVTLKPTAENPLGIFYRNGSLTVYNNVIIQGTLVATSTIYFNGKGIHVTAFNWRGEGGEPLISDAHLWPRIPTLVADDITFDRTSQTTIEGAVICYDHLNGAGGSIRYPNTAEIQLTGTATTVAIEQPYSTVTLHETQVLNGLSSDGNYAIWLNTTGTGHTGSTGTWYPIVGVDNQNQQLTVRGEINHASPTSYRIKRHKQELTQIRGPICAETIDFNRVNEWVLWGSLWDERKSLWDVENQIRALSGEPLVGFSEWLESTWNFPDWNTYYQLYGMNLEPTLHVQHLNDQSYRWAPPLFQAYDGEIANADQSGYRWSLMDWREFP
ncbi:MAG: hypothetical protein QM501_13000 [Gimesia sp.]